MSATKQSDAAPVVSVITPCYNAARYIGRTIESVAAQRGVSYEHVIIDDSSTDGSENVIATYAAHHPRIRFVRRPNSGCAKTRNAGFRLTHPDSRYLLFLDADDLLEPGMLATIVEYLDARPEVGLAYGDFSLIDASDRPLAQGPLDSGWQPRFAPALGGLWARRVPDHCPETPFASLFALPVIIPSVCVFRRSIYEQTAGWDEEMGIIYEDISLYLHVALRSKVHYVPRKFVQYRKHQSQSMMQIEKFAAHEKKLYAKWENMPGLDRRQRKIVEQARRFREGRLALRRGFAQGGVHLRRGAFARAAQFGGGAIRRYFSSFLPIGLWNPRPPARAWE